MEDCVFCKIIKKEIPTDLQFENEEVVAFNSIEPAAETHILVVPKKHISTFLDIKFEDSELFSKMISVVQELVSMKNLSQGYKLIFNGGKYQTIPHLHWHLLAGDLDSVESKI